MTFGLVKHNNNSISAITSAGQLAQGKMTFIKEQTASSSSSISFVDGSSSVVLDNTYPIYLFKFISIHPATDNVNFFFNLSSDGGSNYNVTKTSSSFVTFNYENGSYSAINYDAGGDLAQSTSGQKVTRDLGNDSDSAVSGHMFLFNPSSTTFVKHFIGRSSPYLSFNSACDFNFAGYGNTTSAVDAVQFTMSSGNIDSGTIKLYGIKGS